MMQKTENSKLYYVKDPCRPLRSKRFLRDERHGNNVKSAMKIIIKNYKC